MNLSYIILAYMGQWLLTLFVICLLICICMCWHTSIWVYMFTITTIFIVENNLFSNNHQRSIILYRKRAKKGYIRWSFQRPMEKTKKLIQTPTNSYADYNTYDDDALSWPVRRPLCSYIYMSIRTLWVLAYMIRRHNSWMPQVTWVCCNT